MTTDQWAEVGFCALLLIDFFTGWYLGNQYGYARRQRDEMFEQDLRDRCAELIEPEDRL